METDENDEAGAEEKQDQASKPKKTTTIDQYWKPKAKEPKKAKRGRRKKVEETW